MILLGSIILIVTLVIEIIFAAYCIHSKSYLTKYRSIIRISAFPVFALLMLSSAVEWSFRWYEFAALLLIWALIGVIKLVRGDNNDKIFKNSRVIGKAIVMYLIILFALGPAIVFPQYNLLETTGTYDVETVIDTYTDESRNEPYSNANEHRKITVQYWYPENADGQFPLIVFSHGSFGVKSSNLSLYRELASHGYVVCAIDHTYQCLFTTDIHGNMALLNKDFMHEVSVEDAKNNKEQSYKFYQKWMGVRLGDINYIIDYILDKTANNNSDYIYKLVDGTKIGVIGHSLGGSAALGIGRVRKDVKAIIALEAPFMCDIIDVKNEKFVWNEKPYPIPVLNVYSDSTWSYLNELPQYAANAKMLGNTRTQAYNVYVRGARHLSLTDLALTSPILTRVLNGKRDNIDARECLIKINNVVLEYFDYYLKGKGKIIPGTVTL